MVYRKCHIRPPECDTALSFVKSTDRLFQTAVIYLCKFARCGVIVYPLFIKAEQAIEVDNFGSMANGTVAPNATDSDVGGSESTSKFIAALVVNLVIGLVVLIVFSILRPRKKIIYSPRQLLLDTITPLGKVPQSIIAWVFPAFVVKDDDVFQHAGIDALIHMRFLKLCFKVSLVIMPYGIAVLLPVNYYGGGELGGLDKIAVSNIVLKSPKVWAHVVAAWIYTVVICYLLFAEWKNFILYRQKYLALGKAHQYAVFVRDLPDKVRLFLF